MIATEASAVFKPLNSGQFKVDGLQFGSLVERLAQIESIEAASAFEFGAGRHLFVVVEGHVPRELRLLALAARLPQIYRVWRNAADFRQFRVAKIQVAAENHDPTACNSSF